MIKRLARIMNGTEAEAWHLTGFTVSAVCWVVTMILETTFITWPLFALVLVHVWGLRFWLERRHQL